MDFPAEEVGGRGRSAEVQELLGIPATNLHELNESGVGGREPKSWRRGSPIEAEVVFVAGFEGGSLFVRRSE